VLLEATVEAERGIGEMSETFREKGGEIFPPAVEGLRFSKF
jgi:hypothetical protein